MHLFFVYSYKLYTRCYTAFCLYHSLVEMFCGMCLVHLCVESVPYHTKCTHIHWVCVGVCTSTLILQLPLSNVWLADLCTGWIFTVLFGPTLEYNTSEFWSGFKGLRKKQQLWLCTSSRLYDFFFQCYFHHDCFEVIEKLKNP